MTDYTVSHFSNVLYHGTRLLFFLPNKSKLIKQIPALQYQDIQSFKRTTARHTKNLVFVGLIR